MSWTAEQFVIAERLDAEVQRLLKAGEEALGIVTAMAPNMPDFKWLLDAGQVMNEMCGSGCFPGLLLYAKILEILAGEMAAGRLKAPR